MSYLKRFAALLLCVFIYLGAVSCTRDISSEHSAAPAPLSEAVSSEAPSTEAVSSEAPSSEAVSYEAVSSEAPSSEVVSSEDASSEDVSSEAVSSEDVSSEDVSSEDVSSEEDPSDGYSYKSLSEYVPPVRDRFTPYSPKVDYKLVWQDGNMVLYNTDFRPSDALLKKFARLFASFPHQQSVVLTEPVTNMAFCYSGDTKIPTASAIKGPMGLFAYKCLEDNVVSWDTEKAYEPRHFQENGTGDVQKFPFYRPDGFVVCPKCGEKVYNTPDFKDDRIVKCPSCGRAISKMQFGLFRMDTLVDYMIRISDNQAYIMIKELLGPEEFEKMMSGLGSTRIIPAGGNWGFITGWEMVSAWREIYYYAKYNENGAGLLDRFMHAGYNYIWRAIRFETAHKSGWSGIAYNDAGIVYLGSHQYIIAVLMGRNGIEDMTSKYQFINVTKLLSELMVEYNAFLDNPANSGGGN